ncbi:hypothetical protein [Candidatus Venteria ishoeyi]|uniref:Uncharacterized protein n=1 Tax=Candidatus Venteria ishoeyi TaxID=1899563 RepID=A0A1H6FI62_9GAMM|nr:hypothetical protein [Candidatus Venteria ishoeyi]MDM8547391.1 hypothetical protein [Candidatus Venteria ishoeyi]SEH08745.1 Uncharacterised protein [Candidatus Venteria ishoeyi]
MKRYVLLSFLLSALLNHSVLAVTISGLPNVGKLTIDARMLGTLDAGQSTGDFDLQWQETKRVVTNSGDSVIAGYFYASQDNVSWGNEGNPEIYTKIWFAQSGTVNLNFFHVGLFEVRMSSQFEGRSPSIIGGRSDDSSRISVDKADWRYVRHDYCWGEGCNNVSAPPANTSNCEGLSGSNYNRCQPERMYGSWELKFKILSEFTRQYTFTGEAIENDSDPGTYIIMGTDQSGNTAAVSYNPDVQLFLILDFNSLNNIDNVYTFSINDDNNSLSGCRFSSVESIRTGSCYSMTGTKLSNMLSLSMMKSGEIKQKNIDRKIAEQEYFAKRLTHEPQPDDLGQIEFAESVINELLIKLNQ